jgi:hypothetical protein
MGGSFDFFLSSKKCHFKDSPFDFIRFEIMNYISLELDKAPIQDPLRFRFNFIAQSIAAHLLDLQGKLRLSRLKECKLFLDSFPYPIYDYSEDDHLIFSHIQSVLTWLYEENGTQKIEQFGMPVCHKGIEEILRLTLGPKPVKKLTDREVRLSVLIALLCPLRQITGSCFATAPAIIIQRKSVSRFLEDLKSLIYKGGLGRYLSGKEYFVPVCPKGESSELIKDISSYSEEQLRSIPSLKLALETQGILNWRKKNCKTVKELIEEAILDSLEITKSEIEEESIHFSEKMIPLYARSSSLYISPVSERRKKVLTFQKKFQEALNTFESFGDCVLLRAWESTIASMTDVKVEIGKWNLSVSLGLDSTNPGGIGAFVKEKFEAQLDIVKEQIQKLQIEFQAVTYRLSIAEQLLEVDQANRLFQKKQFLENELKFLEAEGIEIVSSFNQWMKVVDELIPLYFQEVFDPVLAKDLSEVVDDSPAGFRLVYKHGRSSSIQWTFIKNAKEFIEALKEFFIAVELETKSKFTESLTTELIQFISSEEFLKEARQRAKKHSFSSSKVEPWEYVSGGTMRSLVLNYFERESTLSTIAKKVRSEDDLLKLIESTDLKEPILIQSPTHAFVLNSKKKDRSYMSYLEEMQLFWKDMKIENPTWLSRHFAMRLKKSNRDFFLEQMRKVDNLEEISSYRKALMTSSKFLSSDVIDSFLHESLPLISKNRAQQLGVLPIFLDQDFYTPRQVIHKIKSSVKGFCEIDLDEQIAQELRNLKLAVPSPILFADTNWSQWSFGISVDSSGSTYFGRFSRTGLIGIPMRDWFIQQKEGSWVIYSNPREYS